MWRPREKQIMPSSFFIWLIMAGRGFGKTKTGAESILSLIKNHQAKHIAIIGQTIKETHRVMINGISGILKSQNCPLEYTYHKSHHTIFFKNYDATIYLFGGDQYEALRGPQFDTVWIDELAKFKYPDELWTQIEMTLRLSKTPRCIITTTPRPLKLLHHLKNQKNVVVTTGSTFENKDNLSAVFIDNITQRYDKTRLGAQELHGELFEEDDGVLFKKSFLKYTEPPLELARIVIGLDPAVSKEGCETGIIVCGLSYDNKAYVLADLSGRYSPCEWVSKTVHAYETYKADIIVVEVNQGGALIEEMFYVHDGLRLPIKEVFAKRNKSTRAEPIVALYEKGIIYHTQYFKPLEEQMLAYKPGRPSDRLDALVWALTELFYQKPVKAQWV